MNFSKETERKIDQFAKEQSQLYLEESEMTYLEKLRRKAGQTKSKLNRKLARFRSSSEQAMEARNDMFLYMTDYMNDLISKGLSEEEAFEKARVELAVSRENGKTDPHADFHERIQQYYLSKDPANYEAIGVFYGGFLFLGIAAGALIGFIAGGALPGFRQDGWIYTLIGIGIGVIAGIGLGLISHAIIATIKR